MHRLSDSAALRVSYCVPHPTSTTDLLHSAIRTKVFIKYKTFCTWCTPSRSKPCTLQLRICYVKVINTTQLHLSDYTLCIVNQHESHFVLIYQQHAAEHQISRSCFKLEKVQTYICTCIHRQKKNQKYRVGTRKCVCTHATSHSGVSVCIVKVIGGYGHGTQNCGCVAPLHGHGNPLQQVVVWPRLSHLHTKTVPQLLKECQGL